MGKVEQDLQEVIRGWALVRRVHHEDCYTFGGIRVGVVSACCKCHVLHNKTHVVAICFSLFGGNIWILLTFSSETV